MHNSVLKQVQPEATHEVVLGDLFGSQWIPDEEFLQRVHRYKDIIFKDVPTSPHKPFPHITSLWGCVYAAVSVYLIEADGSDCKANCME